MDNEDEYEVVSKKPLKLTSDKDKISKRGSKSKHREDPNAESKIIVSTSTKAEKAFKARQEKVSEGRILKKASKTHKQRVEEFNKHLDSLSEHYDIPKVSWTK